MSATLAANAAALRKNLQNRFPGVVIYWLGDAAHQAEVSGHNPDDTPGLRAEQSDSDSLQEVRALDVMLGAVFTADEAERLVAKLINDAPSKARLYYVIYKRRIWRRHGNWAQEVYTGTNPHTDHVHISTFADDDANPLPWPVVMTATGSGPTPVPPPHVVKKGDGGTEVGRIQEFLRNTFPAYRFSVNVKTGQLLSIDNNFGDQTEAWVKQFQLRTNITADGIVGPATFAKMREYGYKF